MAASPRPQLNPDLCGAFKRFYVWRSPDGGWHARPLPNLTFEEMAFGVLPELTADSPLQLAFTCTWQRSRRNVCRYLSQWSDGSPQLCAAS
ncbi:hypothetical protein HII36_09565 [Nonomuraea sp. NN258]|uniref:hypothetical protein n=1 Tax=Nonomuraea antri TaxID=2730852 RepID=UPI0015688802|nr:hypothetical protein [Nonomuraea antri]NRQ32084.1 hypothetical protein [Nonomuraea antri]